MIKIIPFTNEYHDQVIQLILHTWEVEFDFKGLERPDIHDIPGHYQNNDGSNFWIALEDKKLIGTAALVRENGDLAYLKRMVVKKEYRKKGLGKKLLHTAIDFAKKRGYKTIYAGTVEENPHAIEFYKRNGFTIYEDVPDGITAMSDSICLKLEL